MISLLEMISSLKNDSIKSNNPELKTINFFLSSIVIGGLSTLSFFLKNTNHKTDFKKWHKIAYFSLF